MPACASFCRFPTHFPPHTLPVGTRRRAAHPRCGWPPAGPSLCCPFRTLHSQHTSLPTPRR
eukprot:365745-Chlamydomonas_euryale.AAC.2